MQLGQFLQILQIDVFLVVGFFLCVSPALIYFVQTFFHSP